MNGTPRLRSAYPSTPPSGQKAGSQNGTPLANLPTEAARSDDSTAPMIPLAVVDAPSQRMYVSAFYIGLILWRCHDYWKLVSNESDSLWLFIKWVGIDAVFLFGLPGLRIPWLEWSSSTIMMVFLAHAFIDGLLMFRIPVRPSTMACGWTTPLTPTDST